MPDFKQPESPEEFEKNFRAIKPLMDATEAHYESSRCLFCYDAPCVHSCPTGIDIPLFIRQINTNNISGASNTIYQSNWMGNICGQVCPTEVLCEGACVYNHQNVKPIEIGRLQSYATSQAIASSQTLTVKSKHNGKSVAVIGAGPAGLSVACELSTMGYKIEIYESRSSPSGLALHGVAPYKITNEQVLEEVNYLQRQFGFEIRYNNSINSQEEFRMLERRFDAIFLGIGLGPTRSLELEGEQLAGCWGAVEFIESLKISRHRFTIPEKVVVLGAGNTAMDAASECARMGANVTLAYRRGVHEMGAYEFEYDLAKSVGIQSLWFVNPLKIIGETKVEGIKFERTELKNGKLSGIPGTEFEIACDLVICATGQNDQSEILSNIEGLELDPKGRIIPGSSAYQTTNPRYFTGGDVYNGGLEVVNAVAEAKEAAMSMHQYLSEATKQQGNE